MLLIVGGNWEYRKENAEILVHTDK